MHVKHKQTRINQIVVRLVPKMSRKVGEYVRRNLARAFSKDSFARHIHEARTSAGSRGANSHSQTQTKPSRREGWMTDEEALHQERARACRQCTDFPEQWRSRGMQGIFSPKQIPGQCWSKTKSTPRLITMMFTANF